MQTNRFLSGLVLVFFILAVVGWVLAVQFRGEKAELARKQEASKAGGNVTVAKAGAESDAGQKASGSSRVYGLLDELARKDASIRELEQRVKQLQSGRPDSASGEKTLKPVWKPRERTAEAQPEPTGPGEGLVIPAMGDIAEQDEFIRSVDVSAVDAARQAKHVELQQRLSALRQAMDAARATQDENERTALRREISQNVIEASKLFMVEREIVFYNLGLQLGYDTEGALGLADYLTYVNDMTSRESTLRRLWKPSVQP